MCFIYMFIPSIVANKGGGAGGVHGTPFTAAIPIRAGDCCAPADRAGEERKKGQRERVQLCVIFFK